MIVIITEHYIPPFLLIESEVTVLIIRTRFVQSDETLSSAWLSSAYCAAGLEQLALVQAQLLLARRHANLLPVEHQPHHLTSESSSWFSGAFTDG